MQNFSAKVVANASYKALIQVQSGETTPGKAGYLEA
jgi:hypothetical protein